MINARKLNETIDELENEVENLKSANELYNKISKTEESFKNANEEIIESSKVLKEITDKNIESLDKIINENKKRNNNFMDKLSQIRNEYKEQVISLEKVQASQLEKNKSDLTVEIRNNITEIQKKLKEHIDEKFIELEKNNLERYKEYNYKLNVNKKLNISLLVIGILILIISIISYFK